MFVTPPFLGESWIMAIVVLWHRQAAYVFQTHAGTQRVRGLVLNYPAGALNTTDERFGTERSTRAAAYTSFEGREEGCGMYKAGCSSCIPSRLLGILSPYPLHAHSRRFSLSRVLSLPPFHSSRSPVSLPQFIWSFVCRLSRRSNIHRIWISCGRYLA